MQTPIFALELAGNYSAGTAIWSGLVGAIAMLAVIYGGRAIGMTTMDLLRTLGTMVLPRGDKGVIYGVGLMMHLMMGGAFGLIHAGLLHLVDPSSEGAALGWGALFGLGHGVSTAVMMPIMLTMAHPLVKSGDIGPTGPAMTGFGKMTPVGITMAHVVFALVAGSIYTATVG